MVLVALKLCTGPTHFYVLGVYVALLCGGLQDMVMTPTIKLMFSEVRKGLFTRPRVLLIAVLLIAVIMCLGLLVWRVQSKQSGNKLPTSIVQQINGSFKPYYLKPSYSTDFTLQPNTVKYAYGVLVFSLKNSSGKTLSITEEATPEQYDPSLLQTTKQFNTEYGQAYMTDSPDRTTGTLFSSDKTWVIINAVPPVGGDFMRQFLEALVPVNS